MQTVSDTSQQGVYSDSDLQSSERRGKIDLCITALFKLAVDVTCGVDIQLVVQLLRNRGTRAQICRYYFVDHRKRLLFWVHDQHTEKLFDGVRGVEKMSHISATSCSSGQLACLNNLFSQSMLLSISTGKSVILYVSFFCLKNSFDAGRTEHASSVQDLISSLVRSHCEMYPNERLPGSALLNDLKDIVVHASAGENFV
jgi:hypothetical protein